MLIYFVILTLFCLSAVLTFDRILSNGWRSFTSCIAFLNGIVLIVFIGLRDGVGGDWESYVALLERFRWPLNLGEYVMLPIEPGYAALDVLANAVGGGIYLVNFLCALIIVFSFIQYAALMKINANYVFFIAAPYILFVVGMNYSRQSVAIAISFVALAHLANGNSRGFRLLMLLAMCFHFTAAVLIVFLRFKRKIYSVLLLGFLGVIGAFMSFRYSAYVSGGEFDSKGVWLRLSMLLVGAFLFWSLRNHWRSQPDAYWILKRASLVVIMLAALSFRFSTIADRIGLYMMFLYVTMMASTLRYIRPNYPEFQWLSIFFCAAMTYAVFFVWFGLSSAASLWIPYRSILPTFF